MADEIHRIVTQLVVDATSSKTGVADFESSMAKAKAAAISTGNETASSFDSAQKRWTNSLAATDPVFRANLKMQQAMQAQQLVGNRAVELGIATQASAAAQLEQVRLKYQGYVTAAEQGVASTTAMGKASSFLMSQLGPLIGLFTVAAIVGFAKRIFETTAELEDQAQVLGMSVTAMQAYQEAGKLTGMAQDTVNTSIQRFAANLGAANESSGAQRKVLVDLGLTAKDIAGGPESALPKVIAALLALDDVNKRAFYERTLFGRGGQAIAPLLEEWSKGTRQLTNDMEAAGLIVDPGLVGKLHNAEVAFNKAFDQMKVAAVPAITVVTGLLTGLLEKMNAFAAGDFWEKLKTMGRFALSPIGFLMSGAPTTVPKAPTMDMAPGGKPFVWDAQAFLHSDAGGFQPTEQGKQHAQAALDAQLAGMSASKQAELRGEIDAANAKLKDRNVILRDQAGQLLDQITSIKQISVVLTPTEAKEAGRLALIKQQGAAYQKVRETFAGYLSQLGEEARLAGLTTEQRTIEEATIKGAQILQKERGVLERNLVKTYEDAVGVLGQQRVAQIALEESQKRINALAAEFAKQANSAAKDYLDAVTAINQAVAGGRMTGRQGQIANDNLPLNQQRLGLQIGLGQSNPFGSAGDTMLGAQNEQIENEKRQRLELNDTLLASQRNYVDQRVAIEQDAAQKIAQNEIELNDMRLGAASTFFGNLATLSQSSNATLAAIGKAAAITQATIDGILAVQKALAAYAPPWNFIMAASVGVATAANVAKIAGFEEGGYTGNVPRNQVAGVVHGQEWVVTAEATAKNRSALDAMNRGASFDRPQAPANMNITVLHDGSTAIRYEKTSNDEIRIIAEQVVQEKAPSVVAADQRSPYGKVAKATRETSAGTKRKLA